MWERDRVAVLSLFSEKHSLAWGIAFFLVIISSLFSLGLSSRFVQAAGAIAVDMNGLPLVWDTQQTLIYNVESDSLSPQLGVGGTLALVDDAFQRWANIAGVEMQTAQGAMLPSINETNFEQFLGQGKEACYPNFFSTNGEDCLTPIIIDDGRIIDALFGAGSSKVILGFAGPDDILDPSGNPERRIVRRGQALFSGHCMFAENGCQRTLDVEGMATVILHEIGHLYGLDHSQVHKEAFLACGEGCPSEFAHALPTMFPILTPGANMNELHRDDRAAMRSLYSDSLNYGCSVSGTVYARDGITELRGAEVVAINTRPNLSDTDRVSFVSGAYAPKKNFYSRRQGNCTERCGEYEINNLQSGQIYQICVQKILPQFTSGSSIEPVDPPTQIFSDDCPNQLLLSCDCSPDELCQTYTGFDIITDADPNAIDDGSDEYDQLSGSNDGRAGGCSLVKSRVHRTHTWNKLLIVLHSIH